MDRIPLHLRLKRETHRKIAYAQDLIVWEVYRKDEKAVLHGGTAIWRCFYGKRFSEDLDFYFRKGRRTIESIFAELEKKGFKIIKKKISERSVYSELLWERTRVRLEATFQKVEGALSDYETSEGNIMTVYSLTPEMFIKEKIAAYLKRLKIRDLWDVFFLLRFAKINAVKSELRKLIKNYKSPADEQDLKAIIIEGIVPSSKEMIENIRRKWEKENI